MQEKNKSVIMKSLVIPLIVILIMGVGIPIGWHFMKQVKTEAFRKNQLHAKTLYLAAEASLNRSRALGEWEDLKIRIKEDGIQNYNWDSRHEQLKDRIYTLVCAKNEYSEEQTPIFYELFDELLYDKKMLSEGTFAVAIDLENAKVYAAYYTTSSKHLNFDLSDDSASSTLSMNRNDYKSLSSRMLGYYSKSASENPVEEQPIEFQTARLFNGEALYLEWETLSGTQNLGMDFRLRFHNSVDGQELFSTKISLADAYANPDWKSGALLPLELKATDRDGIWSFPFAYGNGRFRLILDAAMSEELKKATDSDAKRRQEQSTSILRLGAAASALKEPQDIYASIQAVPHDAPEQATEWENTNIVNTLYDEQPRNGEIRLSTMRHLYNLRYCEEDRVHIMVQQKLDWTQGGLYRYVTASRPENVGKYIKWTSGKAEPFPPLEEYKSDWSFGGINLTPELEQTLKSLLFGEN